MPEEDRLFLQIIHDPALRPALLARLSQLGLLDDFRAIGCETTPMP